MDGRSDEELMLAYAGGETGAFRTLFQRYAPTLLRLMARTVRRPADAQDLVQQTFLQLHRARRDFRADARLKPWIVTIAMNLARDLLRRRGRRPESELEVESLPADTREPAIVEDDGVERRVRQALSRLPRDQREVIELHWFEELSFNEIAGIVGASAGAVRVRAHRGYVALRKALGPGGPLPGEGATDLSPTAAGQERGPA